MSLYNICSDCGSAIAHSACEKCRPECAGVEAPMQPIYLDECGTAMFKANAIVRYLLEACPFDMNQLGHIPFSDADHEQFAQLIGYSITGYAELAYVSDETYAKVEARVTRLEDEE